MKNVPTLLTVLGMCATVIIFVFTTFQTKTEAVREAELQGQNIEQVDKNVREIKQDMKEWRRELNSKVDRLIERRH